MMIKNRTNFVLITGIGLSLFSRLSHTAFAREDDTALLITNLSAPARLGALALIHDDQQRFSVLRESGEINEIPNHLVARGLREISQSEVKVRLNNRINFRVQQGSDGEFSVQESGGLDGGYFFGLFTPMGVAGLEKFSEILAAHPELIPAMKSLGTGMAKGAAAATLGIKVVAVGGVVGGSCYGAYKGYRYWCPTSEEQGELDYFKHRQDLKQCLLIQNQGAERDANGMPSACAEHLRKFAIMAKSPAEIDDIVNTVKKFSQQN